jgi:hypothetical protein
MPPLPDSDEHIYISARASRESRVLGAHATGPGVRVLFLDVDHVLCLARRGFGTSPSLAAAAGFDTEVRPDSPRAATPPRS